MTARLNVALSDKLNEEIEAAAQESETTKSEVFRKALTMYLAMRDGHKRGLKVGLIEPTTQKLETEFIGL